MRSSWGTRLVGGCARGWFDSPKGLCIQDPRNCQSESGQGPSQPGFPPAPPGAATSCHMDGTGVPGLGYPAREGCFPLCRPQALRNCSPLSALPLHLRAFPEPCPALGLAGTLWWGVPLAAGMWCEMGLPSLGCVCIPVLLHEAPVPGRSCPFPDGNQHWVQ